MIDRVIMNLATEFAPGLARRLFGDGAGDVAERLAGLARRVTGAQTPEEALERLRQDAEARAEFQRQAAAFDHELELAYLADVQSARARDMAFLAAGKRNWRADVLALLIVMGLIANAVVMMYVEVPPNTLPLLNTLQGALIAGFVAVVQFEFGSSRGSKDKSSEVAAMARELTELRGRRTE